MGRMRRGVLGGASALQLPVMRQKMLDGAFVVHE